ENWDDCVFRERILAHIQPGSVVLDLGAGSGLVKQTDFRDKAKRVYGVDLDPRVSTNPLIHEGVVADVGRIPFEDRIFDVVFSNNVLEHLEDPLRVFSEVSRVLKPGGVFLFKTPQKFHYVPLISKLTPHWFHEFINRLRGRAEMDTFPTRYFANTASDIAKYAARTGFKIVSIEQIEKRPEYLRINALLYFFGVLYERIVNSCGLLAPFRVILIGQLQRV
ncbi:MAG: class I SAM-dependent methyltransferase, partial [Acidobacteria bacterium]|nr:class I SAM-dependent methyltransferase [Acidobacteriota bacterium]